MRCKVQTVKRYGAFLDLHQHAKTLLHVKDMNRGFVPDAGEFYRWARRSPCRSSRSTGPSSRPRCGCRSPRPRWSTRGRFAVPEYRPGNHPGAVFSFPADAPGHAPYPPVRRPRWPTPNAATSSSSTTPSARAGRKPCASSVDSTLTRSTGSPVKDAGPSPSASYTLRSGSNGPTTSRPSCSPPCVEGRAPPRSRTSRAGRTQGDRVDGNVDRRHSAPDCSGPHNLSDYDLLESSELRRGGEIVEATLRRGLPARHFFDLGRFARRGAVAHALGTWSMALSAHEDRHLDQARRVMAATASLSELRCRDCRHGKPAPGTGRASSARVPDGVCLFHGDGRAFDDHCVLVAGAEVLVEVKGPSMRTVAPTGAMASQVTVRSLVPPLRYRPGCAASCVPMMPDRAFTTLPRTRTVLPASAAFSHRRPRRSGPRWRCR